MRVVICFCAMWLFLLSLASQPALASKPSAHGNVDFSADDGVTRSVHFNAKHDNHGLGDLTFTDPSATLESDPDNPEGSGGSAQGLSIHVTLDCLVVDDNRAVMGGVIDSATFPTSIGGRVLLAVEDNGEGSKAPPDRLAWGIYATQGRTWVPSDAELEDDQGASLTWTATDAEREDDVGIPAGLSLSQSQVVGCASFPFSAYALIDLVHGDGNIQVKP